MNNKQRMLMAMRGEMPDTIPFAPRLDLWFSANRAAGTLPEKYKDCAHYIDIARAEGWRFTRSTRPIRIFASLKTTCTGRWEF